MSPEAGSFSFLLGLARSLLLQVTARDGLDVRPVEVCPAVIGRLAAGVAVLASFVRRLLVLMALSMEHGLVDRIDRATPLARPHGRKSAARARFVVLDARFVIADEGALPKPAFDWADQAQKAAPAAKGLSPARLYQMLDLLGAIVADPEPRARRLAFYLARRRHGPILPPAGPARIAGRWGTEIRASHDGLAAAIFLAGRARPPPLPPPRRAGPMVTGF
jgi:hypothetical protein